LYIIQVFAGQLQRRITSTKDLNSDSFVNPVMQIKNNSGPRVEPGEFLKVSRSGLVFLAQMYYCLSVKYLAKKSSATSRMPS